MLNTLSNNFPELFACTIQQLTPSRNENICISFDYSNYNWVQVELKHLNNEKVRTAAGQFSQVLVWSCTAFNNSVQNILLWSFNSCVSFPRTSWRMALQMVCTCPVLLTLSVYARQNVPVAKGAQQSKWMPGIWNSMLIKAQQNLQEREDRWSTASSCWANNIHNKRHLCDETS